MQTKTKLIGAAATVAALSAVGVGVAFADPQASPSATPGASSASSPTSAGTAAHAGEHADRQHARRALFARALHGQATVGGAKKHKVIDFQRGTVTAVNGSTLTVKSVDGFSASYRAASTTKIRKNRQPAAIGAVAVNDRVRVIALQDGSSLTLRSVRDAGPKR